VERPILSGIFGVPIVPIDGSSANIRDERSGLRTQDDAYGEDHANPNARMHNRVHCKGIRLMCEASTTAKTAASTSKSYNIQKSRSDAKNQ